MAVFVLVVVVLGIQKVLYEFHWEADNDPILSGAVAQIFNAVLAKPLVDKIAGFLGRLDELIDRLRAEVFTVSLMLGIRYYKGQPFLKASL